MKPGNVTTQCRSARGRVHAPKSSKKAKTPAQPKDIAAIVRAGGVGEGEVDVGPDGERGVLEGDGQVLEEEDLVLAKYTF